LINNRQGGRRRGRGGQRGQNLGGQPGNRQDNRQRGNAAQLLEKYKNMARDAQLSGDRVQTEYYLQYADHYFRLLSENRARFEDQRRQRGEEFDVDEGEEELAEAPEGEVPIEEREERRERGDRFNRRGRPRRGDSGEERGGREESAEVESAQMNGGETIPFDILPPAIGRDESETAEAQEEEPRRPRRRSRTPRTVDGDDEIAPAA
jgi:hypothetical protein